MQIGRRTLYADVREVTRENVIKVISDVLPDFQANCNDCEKLLQIEAGNMPLKRIKMIRPEIDIQTVDNVANEIATFKESYHFGNVVTLVSRGLKDSGSKNETEAIALLNEYYSAENVGLKQRTLGHFVEICGIGYTYVNIKSDWVDGDSLFELEALDPRYAFVVRSSLYTDHRIILGVTFRKDKDGNTFYTAFTDKFIFDIANLNAITTGRNLIGVIPIIEWERATDRMGVFEREIAEIERLNTLLSDIANDVDQNTQILWHTCDVSFPHKKDEEGNETDEILRPVNGEWIVTESTKDGKQPFIKPLTMDYDYEGMLNNYTTSRALILERCYTPQRSDNTGGSTGLGSDSANGFQAAEQVACAQQLLIESSKMNEVKVVLAVIKASKARMPEESLLSLRPMDVKPNVTRTKLYEMTVKTTALANMLSHGIHGLVAMRSVGFFEDVNQAWEDSKELIEQYQRKTFGEDKEVQGSSDDPINQITNSPLIDGMSMEKPDNGNDTN